MATRATGFELVPSYHRARARSLDDPDDPGRGTHRQMQLLSVGSRILPGFEKSC